MIKNMFFILAICLLFVSLTACSHVKGNIGHMPKYSFDDVEPEWIRSGAPIEYEGEKWYPQDSFDILLDQEVILLGEQEEVPFFVDKIDVRPFNRLYTKFGRNKFRIYEKEYQDD